MASQQDKVTVYSKPACVQCDATYRALDKKGIEYTVVDISADVDALERVRALGTSRRRSSSPARSRGAASAPTRSPHSRTRRYSSLVQSPIPGH